MNNPPWHLSLNINNIRTIFQEQILPYEVECYICSCGKNEIFIKDSLTKLEDYECCECSNIEFYKTSDYQNNVTWYEDICKLFPEDFLLSLEQETLFNEEEKHFSSNINIYIPSSIDLASNKLSYDKKTIFQIYIDKYGFLVQQTNVNFDLNSLLSKDEKWNADGIEESELINRHTILINYKKKILDKLKQLTKSNLLKKTTSIEQFSFFLKNDYLLDLDFFYWKDTYFLPYKESLKIDDALDFIGNYRTEKTLKKAIYINYRKQLRKYNSYEYTYIYSVAHYIKDVNIAIRMLEFNFKSHLTLINGENVFYLYMNFLTTLYSDKQIEKLFETYSKKDEFWLIHSIRLFLEVENIIDDFPKTKCNYKNIHDALVKFHKIKVEDVLMDTIFTYEDVFNQAAINLQSYEIKLPKNGKELYAWSNELRNCLSVYYKSIQKRETTIYGFFLENQIKFAVEIRDNQIIQAKAKYNDDLNSSEKDLVFSWFDGCFGKNTNQEILVT